MNFTREEDAARAIDMYNGYQLRNKRLKVCEYYLQESQIWMSTTLRDYRRLLNFHSNDKTAGSIYLLSKPTKLATSINCVKRHFLTYMLFQVLSFMQKRLVGLG